MNRERELLKRSVRIIESLGPDYEAYNLIDKIGELLAQPEQTEQFPLPGERLIEMWRDGYDAWYKELRSSKSSLPDAVFEKFYEKACNLDYELQYGPDAIVDYLEGLVEFYNEVYDLWDD